MFLKLAAVLALSPLTLCAIWGSIKDVPRLDWDFIIIGGGTAGSVLASRLTENAKSNVLLIEAGPNDEGVLLSMCPGLEPTFFHTRYDWNFTTVPIPGYNNRSIGYPRGHILGGSSSINGMVFTRGAASDYDRWARVTGDPGWSWANLQPYVKRQEKFQLPVDNHNIAGQFDPAVHNPNGSVPVSVTGFLHPAVDSVTLQMTRELSGEFALNLDFNSGTPLGIGWLQATIGHDGTRSSAATSYLTPQVRSRKNLHIVTDTFVTRILRTPEGSRSKNQDPTIRTIEITSLDNPSETILVTASKEVILSAGAIGTPHILLNSGIGDRNDLEKLEIPVILHNPSVGRNLTDHTSFNASFGLRPGFIDLGPWANLSFDAELQSQALALWEKNRTGPYTALVRDDHLGWVRVPDDSPIFKMFPDTSSGPTAPHIEMTVGASYHFIHRLHNQWLILNARQLTLWLRGSALLRSPRPPLINPNFYDHPFDILATLEGMKASRRLVSAPALRDSITGILEPFANASTDAEIENAIREIADSAWHPVGAAAMSPKGASWGVVDPDLKVKGVNGLRIIDASIMPYIPAAHTQAAVYFIAERGADLVKETWK